MRASVSWLIMIGWMVLAENAALAQQPGGRLTAEQPGVGRLETRIDKYDQALGVTTRLSRPLGAETECEGVCYFPNSSRPVAWRCGPTQSCELHCAVNPPVGGCR